MSAILDCVWVISDKAYRHGMLISINVISSPAIEETTSLQLLLLFPVAAAHLEGPQTSAAPYQITFDPLTDSCYKKDVSFKGRVKIKLS